MAQSQPATGEGVGIAAAETAGESVVNRHELAYTFWPPLTQTETLRAVVIVDSGVVASSDELLHELRFDGFAAILWNPEHSSASDPAGGLTMSAMAFGLDMLTRVLFDDHRVALEDIFVVAQGAEALAALTWAHDYAPRIRSVIVASSGLLWESGPSRAVKDNGACTRRIVQDAEAIDVPLLVLRSDAVDDELACIGDALAKGLAGRPMALAVVAGDSSRLSARQTARGRLRGFLRDACSRPFERPRLLDAHERGFTKDELDRFLRPLPIFSKRRMRYAFANVSIRTVGRLSSGMRLGLQTGFDSGSTMEYVYANVPSGVTAIGRKIDESYLSAPGWVAIRERRWNLQRLIAATARRIQEEGRELHVVDIAAGHGRYVMDALLELRRRPESVLLQDYVDANVQRGRVLLREVGLADIGAFVPGDAFDGPALAAMRPRPTLAIACGIYELFPDNSIVIESLVGLSQAMEQGSHVLYTNQPWQPMLEFFVRVVPSHRPNHRYIARRRTQAEMDQLVELAGFTKISQATDPEGIFTVSVARKTSHPNMALRAPSAKAD
jgi:hypothetical protein